MSSSPPLDNAAPPTKTTSRRASFAAFTGSAIEYYDLVAYGTAAALVFGDLFFRDVSTHVALLLSFATFAAGYVARPLGGLLFGYVGDKYGRRTAVLLTISVMGAATVCIGLLPTYDSIGSFAPVLLVVLRVLQGLAVGGELGGAVLISVEHAPKNKRGFYGSFSTAGAQGGTLLATIVFAFVTLMPDDLFNSWGWRIPFLLSAVIVLVGMLIRRGLDETPDFKQSQADRAVASANATAVKHNPIRDALSRHPMTILGITFIMAGMMSIWYVITVYSLSYAVNQSGIPRTSMLWVVSAATLVVVLMNPVWGALSDRVSRSRLIVFGLLSEAVLLFFYFAMLGVGNLALVFVSLILVAGLGHAVVNGIFPAFVVESLPAAVRYTAGSFGMQLAALVAGFAPLVATALEPTTGGVWTISAVCLALCTLGAFSAAYIVKIHAPQQGPVTTPVFPSSPKETSNVQ
ncbi:MULTISPECIES: MFS transporter [Rhodococcus]|uniref:Putative proline/betaine transporter n=1 Tax=Rhodococcus oxybenzonivorans TaxID=1990687 RepID=A0AAE4UXP4_9NOCA|nr:MULTISPECIES: MFS transporter [Rhodococcus]MDV7241609.1 MFS transporter [Rhodococcus oxybenzonivorans]MDV7264194.1 MFS transporter [Rhodococcus oxybenzonivorans]MDV7273858.1 MFS transporter [Rhodococcus oxybenzonivorans]MDV7333890.1 MFS transporter [Rhodococcus oxybenzonivorans]MDV7343309.1 MFS transporter [Rhodococcus oxybenzonivorans]